MVSSSDIIYRYSPESMSEDVLRKLFVGREKLLESQVNELANAARKKTPRFFLIVGPRGIGKSHFLVLLYYEIKNKQDSLLIPVKLAEEEYSVFRASDLFLRILEEKSEKTSDILSLKHEDEILDAALEKLKQISKKDDKMYLLFIENLHELFRQLDKKELKKLRSIFQKYDIFSVVASAPMIFPGISEHNEPFYNFFRIQHLREFSLDETKMLMKKIAEVDDNREFLEEFGKYEEKIHGMAHLTGGSPRLVILFYEMVTRRELENIEKAFFKIIDEHTPYYQEIFQLLTGQRRKIFDILISSGRPITPKQISENARIDLPIVTTQLRRLEKDGYVISRPMGRHTKYEVRERLFRLWREMRQPFGRKRVSILLEFLKLWYSPKEREELFKAKFDLLDTGKKIVLKDLCYYAEVLPPEFKTEALLKLTPKLLELGELEEAAYGVQKLKETAAQNSDRELKEEALRYEGRLMFSERRYEEALEAFNKVLEINPNNEFALFVKGLALLNLGRYEEALEAFNRALEINPKDELALSNKGLALRYLGRYEEALEAFNRALEINPKNEFVLSWRGDALGNLGRYEEALEAFNRALEINPKDEFVLSNKGVVLGNLGRHDEALEAFNKALEISPKDEFVLSNKGAMLGHLGRYEEALEAFNKVLEINPKDELSLLMKGFALGGLDMYAEALDAAKMAKDIATSESSKIAATLILIKAYISLDRNTYAILEIEKIKSRIADREAYLIEGFTGVCLDLALGELKAGNRGNGARLMKMAYDTASSLKEDKVAELTMDFLKGAIDSGKLPVIKAAVDRVIELRGDEYRERIRPIIEAIDIVETRDIQKYYDLQVEEREIVADIVRKITRSNELVPEEIMRKESR